MTYLSLEGIRAAIFDMDGTMINNNGYHKNAWFNFCKKYGITMSDKIFMEHLSGRRNKEILTFLFNRELTDEEVRKFGNEKEEIYRDLYAPCIREVQGLKDFIEKLRTKGLKIAIATTAPKPNREFYFESLDLGEFEVVVGEEHTRRGKPDPEIYLVTAQRLGLFPKDCIVFEDSPSGVTSAKNAGMRVVGLLTSHKEEELKNADILVNDFSELQLE